MDQIYPNSGVCPRLNTLSTEIYATNDFIKENTSAEIVTLSNNLDQILGQGQWSWNYIFDCMMTTVCTGRPIPDGNAATGVTMNDAIFNATINQVAFQESYLNLYSDSEWAKLAMGNTAWHIRNYLVNRMDNITGVATTTTDDWPNPFKFVLFSAHDTTLISLLAAICSKSWDRQWPGYASLLSIELYEAANSTPAAPKFLSRFVYNSKPLLVDGCPDTLCDTNIILNTLGFGQETMPGCSVPASNDDDNSNDCDDGGMTTTDWAITSCLTAALGMLIGAGIVVFTDKRRLNYSVYEDERKRDIEIKGTMSPLAVGPSV